MLEASHKLNIASTTLQELVQTRLLLLEELNMKTKRQYILRHRIYYEQGNKSGRLLTRAIQNIKSNATIHHIKDNQGNLKTIYVALLSPKRKKYIYAISVINKGAIVHKYHK